MVLHGSELKVKPTTEENQLGFSSFGISQNINGRKHWKKEKKLKEGSEGSTIVGRTVRNTQLVKIGFEYNSFSLKTPNYINLETKTVFRTQKIKLLFLWSQGNQFLGHLWIQTHHNLDHKCSDYGQRVTKNMCDQTLTNLCFSGQNVIGLFLYGRSTREVIYRRNITEKSIVYYQ